MRWACPWVRTRARRKGFAVRALPDTALAPRLEFTQPRERHEPLTPWLLLAGIVCVAAFLVLLVTRGTTFWRDEWYFIQYRDGHDLVNIFDAHAGHLSAIPVSVYLLFFKLVGLGHYWVYRILIVLVQTVCTIAVFEYSRRRVGPYLSLIPAPLIAFLGTRWFDLLWPFQIGFMTSVAAGL